MSPGDLASLAALQQAFAGCARPAHFTNFEHCEECAEHDQTLLSRNPDSLTLDDVGSPGWDPICFISPEGFAYYLPGLARLVLEDLWYGDQFFRHLIRDGPGNARYQFCSAEQRQAVATFLARLIETRAEQIDAKNLADDALRAHQIWAGEESA